MVFIDNHGIHRRAGMSFIDAEHISLTYLRGSNLRTEDIDAKKAQTPTVTLILTLNSVDVYNCLHVFNKIVG